MSYGTSDISNFIEGSLKIYRWDGSSWTVLSDCVVDKAANTVTCSTTHFSVFGVFGHAKPVVVVAQNTTSPTTSTCDDATPKSSPTLSAVPQGTSSILLSFTAAEDPVASYDLEYGKESGTYTWVSTTIGDKNIRSYLVESLTPDTSYYFRVRAVNGCANGEWSQEVTAKTNAVTIVKPADLNNTTVPKIDSSSSTTSVVIVISVVALLGICVILVKKRS
jgi:hypothetical protein